MMSNKVVSSWNGFNLDALETMSEEEKELEGHHRNWQFLVTTD